MRDDIAMRTGEQFGSKLRLHVLRVHRPKWPCTPVGRFDYLTFGLWHNSVEARKQPNPAFIEHMRGREIPTRWLSSYLHRFAKQRDCWPVRRLNSLPNRSTAVSPQSLADADLERVREILVRFGDKRAMNLEQIGGLLAALVCGPDDIPRASICPRFGETAWSMRQR